MSSICKSTCFVPVQIIDSAVTSNLVVLSFLSGQLEAGDLNHKLGTKTMGPTLLDVMQNMKLPLNECKLGPLDTAEDIKDVIPDTYGNYNPVKITDHKTKDASKQSATMKEDDKLNYRSDAEIVVYNLLDEMENTDPPLNDCKRESLNTSEEAKYVIPDSFDENNSAKEAGHLTYDASKPTSIKKEVDKSQNDLNRAGILLSDSFLACLEEEFVKIESERVQNSSRLEVPLSESITCRDFENTALSEKKIAGLPLENKLDILFGPYLHPQPVLSVTLCSKGDSLEMCVLCGASNSCERSLYVTDVTSQAHPLFVGYTSMLFLSSEEPSFKGNVSFLSRGIT